MNENGNKYAFAALKEKRATLAGEIEAFKKQIAWRQEQLAHVDATLRLFDPDVDPSKFAPKKVYKHIKLFKQGELSRLLIDTLRVAGKPVSTADIVAAIVLERDLPKAVLHTMYRRVRGNLHYHESRGTVVKSGDQRSALWALPAS